MKQPKLPHEDELAVLANEIAELAVHMDAAAHRQLVCIRRFDELEGWARQGALTCAHWLSWRTGLKLGAAHQKVRVAHALGALPLIDDAFRRGAVSYSKVRAMTRVATKENEATLLEIARFSTADQLENLCRKFRDVVRTQVAPEPASEDDDRWVRSRETESGMARIQAQLRPEEAAVVMKALEAAVATVAKARRSPDVSAETGTGRFTKADALVAVAEAFLSRERGASEVPGRFEVMLRVDAPALRADVTTEPEHCELDDGTPLARETARQIACDAPIVEVRDAADGSGPVIGRRTRTIPVALRRALRLRDGGCRFPGCTNRIFVDAHHIEHWADGGETVLENLVELCRRHHRLVHPGGFRCERLADGGVAFFDPHGRRVEPVATSPEPPADPLAAFGDRHRRAGLTIGPGTAFPEWDGERMDYALAVDALLGASGDHFTNAPTSQRRIDPLSPAEASVLPSGENANA